TLSESSSSRRDSPCRSPDCPADAESAPLRPASLTGKVVSCLPRAVLFFRCTAFWATAFLATTFFFAGDFFFAAFFLKSVFRWAPFFFFADDFFLAMTPVYQSPDW